MPAASRPERAASRSGRTAPAAPRGAPDLEAARGRTVPDVLPERGAEFDVLFCGINPGLYSAATGHHFARPGNRFWPALHRSGFTGRQLSPAEQDLLPALGLGITNLVARATAQAAELAAAEITGGAVRLRDLVAAYQPRVLAVAGVTAYRVAFGRPRARVGPQEQVLGGTRLWVLPNPSGINAHWPLAAIVDEFSALRSTMPGDGRQHLSGTPAYY